MPGELETEKPQGEAAPAGDSAGQQTSSTSSASKSVVGIIYPPPEVRSILHNLVFVVGPAAPYARLLRRFYVLQ